MIKNTVVIKLITVKGKNIHDLVNLLFMSQLMIAGNNIYSENYFNEKLITEHHEMADLLLMSILFIINYQSSYNHG